MENKICPMLSIATNFPALCKTSICAWYVCGECAVTQIAEAQIRLLDKAGVQNITLECIQEVTEHNN